jgi:hypothetical protein
MGHFRLYLDPQSLQVSGDDLGRPEFAVAQLWILMKIPTPGDDLRLNGLGCLVDAGAEGFESLRSGLSR